MVQVPAVDEVARAREAGRVRGLIIFGVFMLVIGAAVAFAVGGVGGIFIAVVAVVIDGFFATVLVRAPQPSSLTLLSPRSETETWAATAAASLFPGLLERNPSLQGRAELFGTVTLSASSVEWIPSPQSARSFGATAYSWDSRWLRYARRLRGLGGLVQLTLENPSDAQTVTLWVRRATSFRIP